MEVLIRKGKFASECCVSAPAISKAVREGRVDTTDDGSMIDLGGEVTRAFVINRLGGRKGMNLLRRFGAVDGPSEKPSSKPKSKSKPKTKATEIKKTVELPDDDGADDDEFDVSSSSKSTTKMDADIKKTNAATAKLNMEMAIQVKRFILREKVSSFFAQLASTVSNLVLPMGQRIAIDIADKMEIDDPEKVLIIQGIIDKENERVIVEFKRVAADADKG